MSNQRVTQLPNLAPADVNPQDLFIIIDRDDISSSTGDSKNITAQDLATYVENHITPGNTAEETIYQPLHGFQIGTVVRMDATSKLFMIASANTTTGLESEVVGIISNVVDQDNFVLTVGGVVNFVAPPYWLPTPPTGSAALKVGTTYFLFDGGTLSDEDPSATVYPLWVSKPYMVGIAPLQGVITNYRGFFRPGGEDFVTTTLYVTASNSFLVGDAIRKTTVDEVPTLGDWTLATADSYTDAEVVGVVNSSSDTYFSITLIGRIQGLSGLEVGETYYLVPSSSIDVTAEGSSRNLTPFDSSDCNQYSKPVYIAISETDAVVVSQRTYPDQQSGTNRCGSSSGGTSAQVTYGPMAYPSTTQPANEDVITLLTKILPTAANNSTALIYWIQPVSNTFIVATQIINYNAVKVEGGWVITQ